jgi:hypothetical protein
MEKTLVSHLIHCIMLRRLYFSVVITLENHITGFPDSFDTLCWPRIVADDITETHQSIDVVHILEDSVEGR